MCVLLLCVPPGAGPRPEQIVATAVNSLLIQDIMEQQCDTQYVDSFQKILDTINSNTQRGVVVVDNEMSDEQDKCLANERMNLSNGHKTKNYCFSFHAKTNNLQKQSMGT